MRQIQRQRTPQGTFLGTATGRPEIRLACQTELAGIAGRLEGPVPQIAFPQQVNQQMLRQHARTTYLSRAYLPMTILSWLARKP